MPKGFQFPDEEKPQKEFITELDEVLSESDNGNKKIGFNENPEANIRNLKKRINSLKGKINVGDTGKRKIEPRKASTRSHEKNMMKAYISYLVVEKGVPTEHSDEIISTLMAERPILINKIVFKHEGGTWRSRHCIPPEIAKDLQEIGLADVSQTRRITYNGKINIFNIPHSRSRTVYIRSDKYVQVRILATDVMALTDGISKVKENMARFGVQEKVCLWTQMGHLSNRLADLLGMDEEEIEKFIPDFDPSEVEHRKRLEQITARLETSTGTPL